MHPHTFPRLLVMAIATALLGGCASSTENAEARAKHIMILSGTTRGPTASGAYYVSWRAVPTPIPVNELFEIEVRVFSDPAMRTPATGVQVSVDAGMPEHGHGMNLAPKTSRVREGIFRAEGMLFHMPGRWELYIDVRGEAGADRAAFEVTI